MNTETFFARVEKRENGCWFFSGSLRSGYPRFRENKKWVMASHWAYRRFKGKIPAGKFVLHKCDEPRCVRPKHLFLGTRADNNRDRHRKGRTPVGEKSSQAKRTEQEVLEIRNMARDGIRYSVIAKRFGITRGTANQIARGVYWGHVPGSVGRREGWGTPKAGLEK